MTRVGVFSFANSFNYLTSSFVQSFPVLLVDFVTIRQFPPLRISLTRLFASDSDNPRQIYRTFILELSLSFRKTINVVQTREVDRRFVLRDDAAGVA
jgi:hypothetical protein